MVVLTAFTIILSVTTFSAVAVENVLFFFFFLNLKMSFLVMDRQRQT